MWGVSMVGRGWRQLGRINGFSLSVFACVAIPAQMKEIQIVIDSARRGERGDVVWLPYSCTQPQCPPLGSAQSPASGLFPALVPTPTLVFGLGWPCAQ